jgi:uncharacterized protein (DUF1697 family)
MNTYVAMIRGIGPGDPNMTAGKSKELFEGLGFTNVQAVLASGNVVFESPSTNTNTLAKRIEKALPEKLGFSRKVIVRSRVELQKLIDLDPFQGIEKSHNKENYLLVTFFRTTPDMPFKLPYTPDNKPYTILGRIDDSIYGVIDMSKSKTPDYMAWLEKQFGKDITSRTPKTIRLILLRMDSITEG